MPFIADRVLDNGLTVLDTEANAIHICNTEPTTFTQATTLPPLVTPLLATFPALVLLLRVLLTDVK